MPFPIFMMGLTIKNPRFSHEIWWMKSNYYFFSTLGEISTRTVWPDSLAWKKLNFILKFFFLCKMHHNWTSPRLIGLHFEVKCFLIPSAINSYLRFCAFFAFYGCSCLSFIEVCINYWYCQLQGNWKINDVYIIASLMIACRVWTCHFQDMNTTKVKVDIFPSKNHLFIFVEYSWNTWKL